MKNTALKIPDKKAVEKFVKAVYTFLFPAGKELTYEVSSSQNGNLRLLLNSILVGRVENKNDSINGFIESLHLVKKTMLNDAAFILESDPAATELIEVIAVYPGFFAIFCYRIAHILKNLSVSMVPRMITEYAHKSTGIDIHPGATIGTPFSIDHGTGIVIGETTIIGNYVKLYQGVTLGALSVEKNKASKKRHPTIEDNVILYAGCTILGGETIVGRNSIIGGNVWLTESVAPYSVVYHKSEIIVRDHNDFTEPINFFI
ncbi:MAG: serine acetyltransferase [Bacteroidales bacterium]|jgi:serine O-acetyltransferase